MRDDIIRVFPIGEFTETHHDAPSPDPENEEGTWIIMKQKGKWLLRSSKTYKTEELCDANKPLPPEWKETKIDGDSNKYVMNQKTGVRALVRAFDDNGQPEITQTSSVSMKKKKKVASFVPEPVNFSSWKQFFEACGLKDAETYAKLFEENEMELDQIPDLTDDILKDIIVKAGPVMKVSKYIKNHYSSEE